MINQNFLKGMNTGRVESQDQECNSILELTPGIKIRVAEILDRIKEILSENLDAKIYELLIPKSS